MRREGSGEEIWQVMGAAVEGFFSIDTIAVASLATMDSHRTSRIDEQVSRPRHGVMVVSPNAGRDDKSTTKDRNCQSNRALDNCTTSRLLRLGVVRGLPWFGQMLLILGGLGYAVFGLIGLAFKASRFLLARCAMGARWVTERVTRMPRLPTTTHKSAKSITWLCRCGGDAGIRTLDTGFGPYAPLAGECLRPLGHVSGRIAILRPGPTCVQLSPANLSLKARIGRQVPVKPVLFLARRPCAARARPIQDISRRSQPRS